MAKKKQAQAKLPAANRKVAAISPSGQRFERHPKTKEDLLKSLKNGSAVVSHVLYFQNKKPSCYMLADPRLVPDFAQSQRYSGEFSSQSAFKKDFPRCGRQQWEFVASRKNNFVPEGTQLAGYHTAGFVAIGGVFGCLVGTIDASFSEDWP